MTQFFGLYRAQVRGVRGSQLRLVCPAVSDQPLNWALPCVPLVQPGQVRVLLDIVSVESGGVRTPRRGAGVWVMFEQGDPEHPVWLGTWMES